MGRFQLILKLVSLVLIVINVSAEFENGGGVFQVKHKLGGKERSLKDLMAHDYNRHGRSLIAGIDFPLGGDGSPTGSGIYYTQIAIGNPSKDYFVRVDTGSDLLWVACNKCENCPKKSDLGVKLKLYNPEKSSSGQYLNCDHEFCNAVYKGPYPGCSPNTRCSYNLQYGDLSTSGGYFVKDVIGFSQVSGNNQTTPANATINFGCSIQLSGIFVRTNDAFDGLIGFGNASTSMISQLASSGKVSKKFAHCLDVKSGGGIFVVGDVVHPKINTTSLILDQSHYNINMKGVKVGNTVLNISKQVFEANGNGTVIDSGTTLAHLPEAIYEPMVKLINASQPGLKMRLVQDLYSCFKFNTSLNKGFPTVTFQFQNSLEMSVTPEEYLFPFGDDEWCIGWQNSGILSGSVKNRIVLGDLVLSNKLVMYDLENQVLGWTNYNCSSTVGLKDDKSGSVFSASAHDITPSSALRLDSLTASILLLLLTFILYCFV